MPDCGKGGGGGGSGGGSGKTGDSGSDSGSDSRHDDDSRTIYDTLMPSVIIADTSSYVEYRINLFKGGTGEGYVSGGGVYKKGAVVICKAWAYTGSNFDRWTGDFNGKDFNVTLKVEQSISATAYFINISYTTGVLRPCFSLLRGVGNPLVNMTIASPGWTGWKGGTYGYVRYDKHGNKKMHNGLDLSANVGTEVYAMIDGVIGGQYVTEQPDKNTRDYPDGYKGDVNGAGNRINIIGHIHGSTVQIGYWHLMAGNPVAINPRTGSPYKKGDRVFRGEVVAYTGRTGNAYNVKEKHLHLAYYKISSNGTRRSANPEELINGSVNWNDNHSKVLTPDIKGIICDEEKKDNISVFTTK
ncbi:MAG: peptidoglycan DD-metalloendopeptidase family protein [Bacteroidales bacterium]|jgi:hypothetical protein|nr:peptidoglycan DD-metalloendopeptidase family protein [Bacteroidales bacterium]MCI1785703.1 peptidoglycan DD-metalloendopeptidase family protein [Bacteroidales bacterium]